MASVDAAVGRIVVSVSNQLAPRLSQLVPPPPPDVDPVLLGYLESPDFAEVARQVVLWRAMRGSLDSGLSADLREQIVQGLRLSGASADPKAVLEALSSAEPLRTGDLDTPTAVGVAHLASAVKNNTLVLRRAPSLADFHDYARQLRARIAAMHGEMRLPHIGVSRSVPYDELYVRPTLSPDIAVSDLTSPGRRTVLLGDPGAGKSTLAGKLTHDIALGADERVPFLLVLRDFTTSFRQGGRELLKYFEHICSDPYNLTPPRDAVEYLLRNGRAVVVLDGLDELVQPELRRRVVRLVEGFTHQYPLTPIVVTARKVGYLEAPLSESLFTVGSVDDFDSGQVADYATRWFALDAATPSHQRARLADAFLSESSEIEELRRNPLLLALLCAMYSSEHYLPRNLAQVYERCAVMLFDRWDSMRGIALPVQFQGRLRAAVQHLAWYLFAGPEPGSALPRSRIVKLLANYLVTKSFDPDEAEGAAERFTEFCTGRAWILTDVGANASEPLFGFTHRTFMEYFAAEHLVRKHTTASSLWTALRSHVSEGSWDVVCRVALQLHDRNVEDGADDVLSLAIRDGELVFAAEALRYLTPRPDIVRGIAMASLRQAVAVPRQSRVSYTLRVHSAMADLPLTSCLLLSLPANATIVCHAVVEEVSRLYDERNTAIPHLVRGMLGHTALSGTELQSQVHDIYWRATDGDLLQAPGPWLSDMDGLADLTALVKNLGPRTLFEGYSFLGRTTPAPVVTLLLFPNNFTPASRAVLRLTAEMARSRRPWIQYEHWARDHAVGLSLALEPRGELGADLEHLLCLPYLEAYVDFDFELPFELTPALDDLVDSRTAEPSGAAIPWTPPEGMSEEVADLLAMWTTRDFNVFE
ncbi:NACHT domain-containing protein [Lentzea sp. PSKA42]|uniref:NACHT domain-containing protein n=1 Tax=Lentzea indica TaxID=2604800 RepID=A0ABX1FGJ3_9PSEU|nr:NACHT domain-containing protein [Lentzea indica]NKE58030.1 NACHT domain-containing protein [Lentzea indica]